MITVPMDIMSALVAVLSASAIMKQTFIGALAVALVGQWVHQGLLELLEVVPLVPQEQGHLQFAPQEQTQDPLPVLLPSTARTAGVLADLKLQRLATNRVPGRPLL